jgi:hypothetical protein
MRSMTVEFCQWYETNAALPPIWLGSAVEKVTDWYSRKLKVRFPVPSSTQERQGGIFLASDFFDHSTERGGLVMWRSFEIRLKAVTLAGAQGAWVA